MVTEQELVAGYEKEIAYQKHMIENLGRWFTLMFILASIGVIMIYFFQGRHLLGLLAGILISFLGILAMLVFGYGIYKGRNNVQKLIDVLEAKLHRENQQ